MKLYHYAPKDNTILEDGFLSIAKSSKNLEAYAKRANSKNKDDIIKWLDNSFYGRSRTISCLTETIKWQNNDKMLKNFIDRTELFSFELEDLINNNMVEKIYCKTGSLSSGIYENFYEVDITQIDCSQLNWSKCNYSKGLFFGVIRHYLIVLKDGVIPSKLIKKA